MLGYCLLGLLAVAVGLLGICLVRALCMRRAPQPPLPQVDETRAGEYGKKLSRMVQCETVSSRESFDHEKFLGFHRLLEELFPLVHRHLDKHEFEGSLLFCWHGGEKREPILLMAHMDVVEAPDDGQWKYPPFSGEIAEGRIWGRGAMDTKCSLFAILQATEELLAEGFMPAGDVYIASSCTEEIGGKGGPATAAWLKEHGVRLGMVLDEGGSVVNAPMKGVEGKYAMIGVAEKGYGDVKFIAHGNGGHSSAPGRNTPLIKLAKFECAVEKKSPFRCEISTPVREMFRTLAPGMGLGMRLIFANLWLFAPLLKKLMPSINATGAAMLQTTIAFTMQEGAQGPNVLPAEASVTANMRFIHHQPTDESLTIIERMAAKYGLDTQVLYRGYPTAVTDIKGKPFREVSRIVGEMFPGVYSCPYVAVGGTDSRFYGEVCDNCVRFAPIVLDDQQFHAMHGVNENIGIDVPVRAVDFYRRVITDIEV